MRDFSFLVSETETGQRVDRVISQYIKDLSRSKIQSLIKNFEFLKIDGQWVQSNKHILKMGSKVEINFEKIQPLSESAVDLRPWKNQELASSVVYEDEFLMVLNKPPGVVVHPGAGIKQNTLVNWLADYWGEGFVNNFLSNRPGIVHRLDRDTSGLMVIAKTPQIMAQLQNQMKNRKISRVYLTLLLGNWRQRFKKRKLELTHFLQRDIYRRTRFVISKKEQGRWASTKFCCLKSGVEFSMLKVKLKTGRTHQIRIHAEHIGMPILGDPVYKDPQQVGKSYLKFLLSEKRQKELGAVFMGQALHSWQLKFEHPVGGQKMFFKRPPPKAFIDFLKTKGRSLWIKRFSAE